MKVKRLIITCGILVSTALFTTLFTLTGAHATLTYEKSSDVQFTFDPILSLTLTGTPTGFTYPGYLITNLAPGNTDVSNVVNAKVTSNNAAGWTLYATVGGTSKEDALVSYADTDLKLSGGSGASDTFSMMSSGSTSLSAGEWGYTLDGGTTYMDLPLYTTSTPKIINQTVDAAGNPDPSTSYAGDTSKVGTDTQIGAYAKTTQLSGTYGNVVNFTATTNIPARQVTVVAGTDVSTVSLDGSTTVLTKAFAEGDSVSIAATCNSNNKFAGWGLSPEFGAFADRNSASTTFTVGANDVTITAHCGEYVMQNMTTTMCPTTPAVAIDSRDGHEYTVAKLADGKCWMLDNLDLDLTSSTVVNKLTSGNTNASETALTYLKNGGGSASDQWAIDGLQLANWGTTPDYSFSQALVNRGGSCDSSLNASYPCVAPYQDANYTNNTVIASDNIGAGSYKIGTYYNYCAASAGSYCYGNGTSEGTPSGNAAYDICPAGWRMPTGGASGEYQALATAIPGTTAGDADSLQAQLSTPVSGAYRSGTAYRQGTYGLFWSSTIYTATNMYRMHVSGTAVSSQSSDNRTYGLSVRCILK